jgi:NAD(P)H-dependent flavin oxidoreductase YrpB (nitropropane dioxygenase family)
MNRPTELLGTARPIIQAPMAGELTRQLAAGLARAP